jgi:hypothetical protein
MSDDLEGCGHCPIIVLSWHLHGETEGNQHKTSVRLAIALAKTQTDYLLNMSFEC